MREACVYALISHGEVLYIGATIDLRKRLIRHKWKTIFTGVRYMLVPVSQLAEMETEQLRKWRPKLNNVFTSRRPSNKVKIEGYEDAEAYHDGKFRSFGKARRVRAASIYYPRRDGLLH